MEVEFVGGAKTVTGSSYIIKDSDYTIMVDCGMFQGKRELRERNYLHTIYAPQKIDALILTHAHIDHSGLIPKLVKEGFYGNIYTTKATADLCGIMLPDSAHIQEMDAEYISRRNKKLHRDPVDPLYTVEHAEASLSNFVPVNYSEKVQIHPRVSIRFRDAGHILGSAIVEMWIEEDGRETKLVFSGDLGPGDQAIIRDPEIIEEADILFIESTYGNRVHKNKTDTYNEFKDVINSTYNAKGNIIIPSFAVGRTQEIIYTLGKLFKEKAIPDIPVYIDSPLAISATKIFRQNRDCFDEETHDIIMHGDSPLDFPNLHFTRKTEESQKLCEEAHGAIIVSASGMCTAGRIKYHLMNNLYRPESTIVFVGYQAEGTLGRRIIEGARQVRVYGEDIKVKSKVVTLGGFSAHADRDQLISWMKHIKNPDLKVFIIHGEEESTRSFAETIKDKMGITAYIPSWGEVVDMHTMRSTMAVYNQEEPVSVIDHEIETITSALEQFRSKFNRIQEKQGRIDMKVIQEDINDVKEMISMLTDEL